MKTIYGQLPPHWDVKSVGDIVDNGDADIQTGPFGTMLHASAYVDNGTPVVAVKDIGDNEIVCSKDTPRIGPVDASRLARYTLKEGDILFGRKGAVDRRAYVTSGQKGWLQGSDCIRLRFSSDKIDPEFVSYVLGTKEYKSWITSNAHGTTMPSLNQAVVRRIPLPLPPIKEQQSIKTMLKALKSKIELNRSMNETLEQMAVAVYKHWFVDFEPLQGEQFRDSELGMIPKEWEVTSIGDLGLVVTDYVANGSFASLKANVRVYESEEYALFVRNTDLKVDFQGTRKYVDQPSYEFLSKTKLYGGEVIISNVGDVGSVFLCPPMSIPMTLGNNILMVNSESYNYLIYYLFRSDAGQAMIKSITGGSAQPKFNKTDFRRLKVVVPPRHILSRFNKQMQAINDLIFHNKRESLHITQLRDFLLSRLLSGELEVKEAVR